MKSKIFNGALLALLTCATIEQSMHCSDQNTPTNPAEQVQTPELKQMNQPAPTTAQSAGQWSTTAKVAAGLAGTAAVAGAVYLYDPTIYTHLAEQTTDLVNWLGGGSSQAQAQQLRNNEQQNNEQLAHATMTRNQLQAQLAQEQEKNRLAEQARIEAEKIAAQKEAERITLQKKFEAEEKAKLQAQETNNLLMGVGAAAGAAGAVGLGLLYNKANSAEQQLEQLKELNNQSEKQVTQLTKQNNQFRAQNQKLTRTDDERNASKPAIETEHVTLACDHQGYPTLDAIKELMYKEYFTGIDKNKLTVHFVNIKNEGNGQMSDKIYSVAVNNDPKFFLKISNFERSDAYTRLTAIQQGRIGRLPAIERYAKIIHQNIHLPILIWIEKFFVYKNKQGQDTIIEMSHAAHGKSLHDILELESDNKQFNAMDKTGQALGYFQQTFMQYNNSQDPQTWTTVSHGDFHIGNIFFDSKKSRIYFIDNEMMKDNQSLTNDLIRFIGWILYNPHRSHNTAIDNIISFINGYIQSFPRTEQNSIELIVAISINHIVQRLQQKNPTIISQFITALNNKQILHHFRLAINNTTNNFAIVYTITHNSDGSYSKQIFNRDGTITRMIFDSQHKKNQEVILKDLQPIHVKIFDPVTGNLKKDTIIKPDNSKIIQVFDPTTTKIKQKIIVNADNTAEVKNFDIHGKYLNTVPAIVNSQGEIELK